MVYAAEAITWITGLAPVQRAVVAAPGDDIYARLVLGMVGSAVPKGLAAGGGLVSVLVSIAPVAHLSSSYLTPGSWMAAVFASGSSAVGLQMVQVLLNTAATVLGTILLVLVQPGRDSGPARRTATFLALAVGLVLLTGAVAGQLQIVWTGSSGGAMVLAMTATKILGISSRSFDQAVGMGPGLSLIINGGIELVALSLGIGLSLLLSRLGRAWRRRQPAVFTGGASRTAMFAASVVMVLALFATPLNPRVEAEVPQTAGAPSTPRATAPQAALPDLPSVVTITRGADGSWEYWVNGKREVVKGFGYNAMTDDESPQEKAGRFDRDFSAMAGFGANTIVGWDETEFDDLLLSQAARHGLGVILPFDLRATFPYEDPQFRQQLLDVISQRVIRYRNSPALRMWGLGNEVLHEIARARGTQERWDAFSPFLVQAADMIHQLDPNHPVVYRDAEDWYEQPVAAALASDGKPRPWFVYSMNFFTTRMDAALTSGPVRSLPHALMISEYGPVGLLPADRPNGYRELWDIIRAHHDTVLGGLAYVWTTAGPEPLDRNFGLTDADGNPVDDAVFMLGSLYRADS